MQLFGIAWWALVGMFGFGAAVGLLASIYVVKARLRPLVNDAEQLLLVLFGMIVTAAVTPVAGFVAVLLTFVAHRIGWDGPLPYLAGAGLLFLALAAGWMVRTAFRPTASAARSDRLEQRTQTSSSSNVSSRKRNIVFALRPSLRLCRCSRRNQATKRVDGTNNSLGTRSNYNDAATVEFAR